MEKEKPPVREQEATLAMETLRGAKIVQSICIELVRGNGTRESMARNVLSFYLQDGTFIGEIDPAKNIIS